MTDAHSDSSANIPVAGLLAHQNAIVTGAGRGIGRAVALLFARAGANVVVSDIDEAAAQRVVEEIKAIGGQSVASIGNVATDAGRQAIVTTAERAFGGIDCLVNNAGILRSADPLELSETDWDAVLDINAKAVFFLSQLVLKDMVARNRGSIVNLASVAGKIANGVYYAHYNASKAAVIAMTRTLAQAVAKDGVRVNCVCPGVIDTAMWDQIDREVGQGFLGKAERQLFTERLSMIPMGRAGTPDDVARVILFLASPLAGYMTGQAVNVTGGWVTW
jgi:meso-butanediol dehydrogenase / (S,S)-butanediol dehydrogenase / diacetyl reductase